MPSLLTSKVQKSLIVELIEFEVFRLQSDRCSTSQRCRSRWSQASRLDLGSLVDFPRTFTSGPTFPNCFAKTFEASLHFWNSQGVWTCKESSYLMFQMDIVQLWKAISHHFEILRHPRWIAWFCLRSFVGHLVSAGYRFTPWPHCDCFVSRFQAWTIRQVMFAACSWKRVTRLQDACRLDQINLKSRLRVLTLRLPALCSCID